MEFVRFCVLLTVTLQCNGRMGKISRRFSNPHEPSVILGAPLYPHHLPPAEPILPGHTLLRPSIGMLKSAVKFPHREQEDGSGVYGHIDNLGIKYDGKNERVLYSGFRRSLPGIEPVVQLSKLKNVRYLRTLETVPTNLVKEHPRERPYKDYSIGKVIAIENMNAIDLLDFFRILKSLRRDDQKSNEEIQPLKAAQESPEELKYVPGKAIYGFAKSQTDSEEGEIKNKTAQFWSTKDQFNHIKFNPEAPDHAELLPMETTENSRNWWFYHQSDFEEFTNR